MSFSWYDIPDRDDFPEEAGEIGRCRLCGEIMREGEPRAETWSGDVFCLEHVRRRTAKYTLITHCGAQIEPGQAYYEIGDEAYCEECLELLRFGTGGHYALEENC